MIRLIAVVLTGLLMLSACQMPRSQAQVQDLQTASDQTDAHRRASIRLQLATNYLEAGQYPVALDEVKKAIALDPNFVDALHVRALVYMGMNERALADDSFRQALSMRPNDSDILNNYGWFLCEAGRYDDGLAHLGRAVAGPGMAGPAKPLVSLGNCQLRKGDTAAAEKTLLQALTYDRNNAVANTTLALAYYGSGDLPRAQQYVSRANGSTGVSPQSLWLGARIARKQGDAATQRSLAGQLRSRFPDSREATALEQGAWDE
jgi:type IV pilus assembly protein PilF